MNIDYNAVMGILKNFLENEKTEILGISVGEERQVREAIKNLLTAYEEKSKELKKEIQDDLDVRNRWGLTLQELEKEKEKNKELLEQNKDMKSLFNIQASIAKELDFNTNEKMVKFKDEYYVPDTMAINANIGEPKTIELRYISATKYLTKFDEEE